MVELQDMRALVEVITNGGLARAARRLGVAKSIVSRRIGEGLIQAAEAGLGVAARLYRSTSPSRYLSLITGTLVAASVHQNGTPCC
jgi:Bacterial regulatory helix-turn-helix protein, lysR family